EAELLLVDDVEEQFAGAVDECPGGCADLDGEAERPVVGLAAGDGGPVEQQGGDFEGAGDARAAVEPGGQDHGRAGAQGMGGDLAAEKKLDDVAEDQAVARAHGIGSISWSFASCRAAFTGSAFRPG